MSVCVKKQQYLVEVEAGLSMNHDNDEEVQATGEVIVIESQNWTSLRQFAQNYLSTCVRTMHHDLKFIAAQSDWCIPTHLGIYIPPVNCFSLFMTFSGIN